jgi:type II secretory pathway pseudopilin PulG
MSPLQGSHAPVNSRGTQRNLFVHAAARKQRGVALLVVLVALGVLVGMLAIGFAGDLVRQNQGQQRTTDAQAQAKEALIGRAVSDDNRPGSLLCPDTDDDGSAELFGVGGDCPSYIGRLPWRTLGLTDLRDSSGERLWYALSNRFRDHGTAEPINNDTKGNRTVYSESTATTLTTEAVAVVFAPGASLGAQIRDAALALCPTTGTTIAHNQCAANYLETAATVNNATTNGPYISAQRSDSFNDRLLLVTTADLMPTVERRVAREILARLQDYRNLSACGCYPWAANDFDDNSVDVPPRTRGGVPIENALPETWGSLGILVPPWLPINKWGDKFYYAVAPAETATHTAGTLTVDVASKNVVLITPGPAGASRPSTTLPDYLDDAENSNNNDIFVTPSSTAYARDRIYVIP